MALSICFAVSFFLSFPVRGLLARSEQAEVGRIGRQLAATAAAADGSPDGSSLIGARGAERNPLFHAHRRRNTELEFGAEQEKRIERCTNESPEVF